MSEEELKWFEEQDRIEWQNFLEGISSPRLLAMRENLAKFGVKVSVLAPFLPLGTGFEAILPEFVTEAFDLTLPEWECPA